MVLTAIGVLRHLLVSVALLALTGPVWAASAGGMLHILAYHDVKPSREDLIDEYGVTVDQLAGHFAWLKHQGYVAVTVDDVVAAQRSVRPLPPKAVLITFDDGFRSFYEHAFPLLKAYGYPAVVAVVGSWQDDEKPFSIPYGTKTLTREIFLTTPQVKELSDSPLIEIASHTYDLHRGLVANASGQLQPAAIAREWNVQARSRESRDAYLWRIRNDLSKSIESIVKSTGKKPRVIAWPYGEYNALAAKEARALGLTIGLSLESAANALPKDNAPLGRFLISQASTIAGLSYRFGLQLESPVRFISVSLDPMLGQSQADQEKLLDQLIERAHRLGATHVFLNALSKDGTRATFGTTHLPSEDLLNRIAWQLRTRLGVNVFVRWTLSAKTRTPELTQAFDDLVETVSLTGLVLDLEEGDWEEGGLQKWTRRVLELHPDDYIVWKTTPKQFAALKTLAQSLGDRARPRALVVAGDGADVPEENPRSRPPAQSALLNVWRELPWSAGSGDSASLAAELRRLQRSGRLHFGWDNDDFVQGAPDAAHVAPVFSRRSRVR
jgi:peptidoglycan/xylan/chitin deacetylase (PgdA/CDA1 family)